MAISNGFKLCMKNYKMATVFRNHERGARICRRNADRPFHDSHRNLCNLWWQIFSCGKSGGKTYLKPFRAKTGIRY